jgi:hypothetical protein
MKREIQRHTMRQRQRHGPQKKYICIYIFREAEAEAELESRFSTRPAGEQDKVISPQAAMLPSPIEADPLPAHR